MRYLLSVLSVAVSLNVFASSASDYAYPISPSVGGRENIEWSTFYSFHVKDKEKDLPRVLMIGDSITQSIRQHVENLLKGKAVITYWVSSYGVVRPEYMAQLEVVLRTHEYSVIHFNNGLHLCNAKYEEYGAALQQALLLVKRLQPKARVLLATCTPLRDHPERCYVNHLNEIATELAANLKLDGVTDLYSLANDFCRTNSWRDECHFLPEAQKKLAALAASKIEAALAMPPVEPAVSVTERELPPLITNCETRVNAALKGKKAFYYCDDVIWLFRDLARQRPKSLFDNPFLAILKEAHDRYGMKSQLNCFYRLDFFYGTDEFTLAEMPDAYKAEWQANKDWLRLGLHSMQEFPDYPFINADYKDMKTAIDKISGEINRFAGPGVFATGAVIHWGTISKEACKALADSGIVMLCSHCGPRHEYSGDPSTLPYGHAMRLLQNRKPETALYRRLSEDKAISSSIGGYNNLTYDQAREIYGNFKYIYDRETGMGMKELEDFQPLAAGINLYSLKDLIPAAKKYVDNEFFVWGNHEQYFHRDYLAYQPEYAAKILAMARLLRENGYEHFFLGDLAR